MEGWASGCARHPWDVGGPDAPPAGLTDWLVFLDACEAILQCFPDSEAEQQPPPYTFLSKTLLTGDAGPLGLNIATPD